MPDILSYPDAKPVNTFTLSQLDWLPWVAPLDPQDLTQQHYDGLVDRARAKSAYFRLLARDPDVLGARTRLDKDIFYSTGGLPRAERELAAAAVSRLNGCIYCASVHARFSVQFSKDDKDVNALLEHGTKSITDGRNAEIVHAAVTLTENGNKFGKKDIDRLQAAGFSQEEILDLIQAAAFFNWANRLMLSLGEAAPE
ncbi:MAG: alkylhydroperoxidase domain protein [Acetobacter okinawensis]|uniref:alkylhydroperoxidase domain protein n=1 Tax=Acetobacter okinawensis TaxID=1076594 RepID=UPI0039E8DD1E